MSPKLVAHLTTVFEEMRLSYEARVIDKVLRDREVLLKTRFNASQREKFEKLNKSQVRKDRLLELEEAPSPTLRTKPIWASPSVRTPSPPIKSSPPVVKPPVSPSSPSVRTPSPPVATPAPPKPPKVYKTPEAIREYQRKYQRTRYQNPEQKAKQLQKVRNRALNFTPEQKALKAFMQKQRYDALPQEAKEALKKKITEQRKLRKAKKALESTIDPQDPSLPTLSIEDPKAPR